MNTSSTNCLSIHSSAPARMGLNKARATVVKANHRLAAAKGKKRLPKIQALVSISDDDVDMIQIRTARNPPRAVLATLPVLPGPAVPPTATAPAPPATASSPPTHLNE